MGGLSFGQAGRRLAVERFGRYRIRVSLSRVLIANRGEIAVRVVRACVDAGLETVAVYSQEDRDALHVRLANTAYSLGGSGAAQTYLRIDKLLDIAQRSAADAVHPGYGFLAESAEFAQAVLDAGLVWIGPGPAAISALGDKTQARALAAAAGAPLLPGTAKPVSDAAAVHDFALEFGFPLVIKAACGGGGRGMRVVRQASEIDEAFASATREAKASFGRGECFIERYLERPQHIETQCLADRFGTVAVLATRDCSLQRRHQKLVEEAPAPGLDPVIEAELARASRAILQAANYVGAATCEFLVKSEVTPPEIAFLEVNTRLQVEHPVTEVVTGIDLVREQFRIAAGEALGYDTVLPAGHAIELRINGENPAAGFLPTPGRMAELRLPGGPGIRCDMGYEAGDTLSGDYDSLIGKIIVRGRDRTEALARAKRALGELEITGITTVVPFLRALLKETDFIGPANDETVPSIHTGWIETDFLPRYLKQNSAAEQAATSGHEALPLAAVETTERLVVEVGGKRLEVVLPSGLGRSIPAGRAGAPSYVGPGGPAAAARRSPRPALNTAPTSGAVTAPMQGTIVRVAVNEGQQVDQGDLLVVLEAMKMEQPLLAPCGGAVQNLTAAVGAKVPAGSPLCTIA